MGSPWLLELLQELQIQSTKLTRRDHLKLYHAKGTVAPVGSVVPGQVMDVLLIVILKCKCGHECDMWHVHDSTACTQYKPILQLKPEDSVGPAGGDSSILREPHRSSSRERETTSIGQHKEGFQISCRETPSLLLSPGPGPARSGQWPSFVNRIEESEHCTAKRQEQVVNMHTMCKACDMDSDSDMCTTAKHVLKTNLSCS